MFSLACWGRELRWIIRITDDTHRSASLINTELDWLRFLRQHGCTVTTPVLANNGDQLKTLKTRGQDPARCVL
jgi:Ser/Thr protein kinase RdoA (MazF antagonist)